ncbi:DUF1127 domain-containing protein [Mesorhizobium sp. BR1-1-13]
MVTILYIASSGESIHMQSVEEKSAICSFGRAKMDTIETISQAGAGLFAARPVGRGGFVSRIVRMVKSLGRWIDGLLERRRSRLALLDMTDDQLKDIGISRCDAHREGIRPFWD